MSMQQVEVIPAGTQPYGLGLLDFFLHFRDACSGVAEAS